MSAARQGALAYAEKEEYELRALLVYLRGRDAAWSLLRDCSAHQRACVFRCIDLAAVVVPTYKLAALTKLIRDVLAKSSSDCDSSWLCSETAATRCRQAVED